MAEGKVRELMRDLALAERQMKESDVKVEPTKKEVNFFGKRQQSAEDIMHDQLQQLVSLQAAATKSVNDSKQQTAGLKKKSVWNSSRLPRQSWAGPAEWVRSCRFTHQGRCRIPPTQHP